jgi:hypothetical protein
MKPEAHIEARMGFFRDLGMLEQLPSPWQVKMGTLVMLPVTLSESSRERQMSRRTWMGQVPIRVPLQILFNPRQLIIDSGLSHTPRQVVKHLLSVYHEEAFLGFDLQLLQSHPGGLELLDKEACRVVARETRWARYLEKLVGGPGYHAGLSRLAADASTGVYPDPLDIDPRFSSLVCFARYCCSLPDWPDKDFYGLDLDQIEGGKP